MNTHRFTRFRRLLAFFLLPMWVPMLLAQHSNTQNEDALQLQKRADEYLHIISAGAPGFDRTVVNKPFSAVAITVTTRVLEDGHRIVHRNVMRQYRDRQGRTRREQSLEALSPSAPVAPKDMIFIYDPVARANYVLDPATKLARAFPAVPIPQSHSSAPLTAQTKENPSPLIPSERTENLGTRSIDGLQCSGTRTTTTLPIGLIGNDAPLVTIQETWFSTKIDSVVQSKTTDPRFGTTDYRLTEVRRADQSLDLFRVPPSYKLESVQ